uniref:PWWP domain-containing protein n=1 Tax=Peronospora matthiolae TaxID=2874970 RepID=A0AAV1T902_9STRA
MVGKIMPLDIGLRVDVLDDEGIWNTGVIADVGKGKTQNLVEIQYDGWDEDYNQWIDVSKHRLAPLHTYTIVKKCWAKLAKWPWWPAFVVLRAPTTASAAHGLEEETKLYVEFFDSFDEEKRSRCWMQKKNVTSFRDCFEERASKNISKNFSKFVEGTQRAKAGTSPLLFSGVGTLPIEYSSKLSEPLEEKKKECSPEQWFHLYRDFSNRYKELYGYSTAMVSEKPASSRPDLKLGKRGPGRPSKKDLEQKPSEDENKSEENEEDESESGKLGKNRVDDDEVTTGRRVTLRNKRVAAEVTSARSNARPRRAKVIEVLTDSSSSMVASSFSTLPCDQKVRAGFTSEVREYSSSIHTEHKATTKVDSESKPETRPAPEVSCFGSKPSGNVLPSQKARSRDTSMPCTVAGRAVCLKLRDERVDKSIGGCSLMLEGSRGQKDLITPPTKPSTRIEPAMGSRVGTSEQPEPRQADLNMYKDWTGGSRYEVDNKPWNILGWLTEGFKRKLQRK